MKRPRPCQDAATALPVHHQCWGHLWPSKNLGCHPWPNKPRSGLTQCWKQLWSLRWVVEHCMPLSGKKNQFCGGLNLHLPQHNAVRYVVDNKRMCVRTVKLVLVPVCLVGTVDDKFTPCGSISLLQWEVENGIIKTKSSPRGDDHDLEHCCSVVDTIIRPDHDFFTQSLYLSHQTKSCGIYL
jgi:hypothetical protein